MPITQDRMIRLINVANECLNRMRTMHNAVISLNNQIRLKQITTFEQLTQATNELGLEAALILTIPRHMDRILIEEERWNKDTFVHNIAAKARQERYRRRKMMREQKEPFKGPLPNLAVEGPQPAKTNLRPLTQDEVDKLAPLPQTPEEKAALQELIDKTNRARMLQNQKEADDEGLTDDDLDI